MSIALLFNLVPQGPGSSFLDALRPGDQVRFRGPAGTFVVRDDDGARDLLFVATGTGIAPIRSMIYARLASGRTESTTLVWGLRREDDIYYEDEFVALARTYPHFTPVITLSQPSPTWTGRRGRVQKEIQERVERTEGLAVYICGNSAMIRDVRDTIGHIGPCPVYWEQYYKD